MRIAGKSFRQISKELNLSLDLIKRNCYDFSDFINAGPIRVKKLSMARLETLYAAYHDKAVGGCIKSTRICLQIIGEQTKLVGLGSGKSNADEFIAAVGAVLPSVKAMEDQEVTKRKENVARIIELKRRKDTDFEQESFEADLDDHSTDNSKNS